jgi:hypothetical protein
MNTLTLEQRVAHLEAELARMDTLLQVAVQQKTEISGGEPNWIDSLAGSISNDALFVEALAYGRQYRQDS